MRVKEFENSKRYFLGMELNYRTVVQVGDKDNPTFIANMCGFKKWNDLIHASDKELKEANK